MVGRLLLLLTAALALSCTQHPPRPSKLGPLLHNVPPPDPKDLPRLKSCVAPTEPSREVMLFFDDLVGETFALQSVSVSFDGCEVFGDSVVTAVVAKARVKQTWIGKMLVPRDRAVVVSTRLRFKDVTGEISDVKSERTFAPHEPSLKIVVYERHVATPHERLWIRYDLPFRPPGAPCIAATTGPQVHFAVRFRQRVTARFALRRIDVLLDDKPLVDESMRAAVLAQVQSGKVVNYDLSANAGCHRLRVDLEYATAGAAAVPNGANLRHVQQDLDVFEGWWHEVRVTERENAAVDKALEIDFLSGLKAP